MKIVFKMMIVAASCALSFPAFAQNIPDGQYRGDWILTSGRVFTNCAFEVKKNSVVTEQCGSSAPRAIRTTKQGASFSYVPNNIGTTRLVWTGTQFNGEFVRNDGLTGPKGVFSK